MAMMILICTSEACFILAVLYCLVYLINWLLSFSPPKNLNTVRHMTPMSSSSPSDCNAALRRCESSHGIQRLNGERTHALTNMRFRASDRKGGGSLFAFYLQR